jgi:hypothetical protein
MKNKIITTALVLMLSGFATNVFAQGRVNFNNSSSTPIKITSSYYGLPGDAFTFHPGPTNVLGTASTANFGVGPASARIQLLAGLTSSSLAPVLVGSTASWNFVTNTASTIAGAQGTFTGGANLPLAGFDGSVPVYLQCVVFTIDGMYGGFTPIIQVNLATGSGVAPQLFSSTPTANQWDGILIGYPELYPAPEPTVLALVGWGAVLLRFGRRKQLSH